MTSVEVNDKQLFCIPSTAAMTQEGGRARLLVTATRELTCLLLSEYRWPYQESFQCEWSDADKSTGGEWGKQGCLRNPTWRVYLDTVPEDKKVCVLAVLAVAPGGPQSVSLHAVKNVYKPTCCPHAAVIRHGHQVVAEPEPRYQE